jgi:hypothetical protein
MLIQASLMRQLRFFWLSNQKAGIECERKAEVRKDGSFVYSAVFIDESLET